jgi:hypothetical protein
VIGSHVARAKVTGGQRVRATVCPSTSLTAIDFARKSLHFSLRLMFIALELIGFADF